MSITQLTTALDGLFDHTNEQMHSTPPRYIETRSICQCSTGKINSLTEGKTLAFSNESNVEVN